MKPLSIRVRLTLSYTAFGFVLFAALSALLYFGMSFQLNGAADAELTTQAAGIVQFLNRKMAQGPIDDLPKQLREHSGLNAHGELIRLRDEAGNWIYRSRQMDAAGIGWTLDSQRITTIRGQDFHEYRVLTEAVHGTNRLLILEVATNQTEYKEALTRLASFLAVGMPVALLLSALGGWWMSGRALSPMSQMNATLRTITKNRLTVRLPVSSNGDELDVLSATLNEMLDRLQEAFNRIVRFTADVSHELRTPLSLIYGNAEMLQNISGSQTEMIRRSTDILEECERMQTLIRDLLDIARADEPVQVSFELVDPADLLARAAAFGKHLSDGKGVHFSVEPLKAVFPLWGDDAALNRLLIILIDNAVRHTVPGRAVTLGASSSPTSCCFEVKDEGCGIDPIHIPRLFDRFYRVEASRNRAKGGMGLGLSLARAIVTSHDGTIEIASQLHQGSSFIVSIPTHRTRPLSKNA